MNKKQQHKETLIDTQLERAFLASLFINAYATEYMHKMQGVVLVDDFTSDEDADTWRVMRKCADQGKELSPLNIYAVGKDMGLGDTQRAKASLPIARHWARHCTQWGKGADMPTK